MTVTIAVQSSTGSKPQASRSSTTSPRAKAAPTRKKAPPRRSPGARSLATISSSPSSLGRHRLEVVHQRRELGGWDLLLEVLGHGALGEALRDLCVRVDDRGLDEGRVLALQDLVEVRADLARRARVGQGVAGR